MTRILTSLAAAGFLSVATVAVFAQNAPVPEPQQAPQQQMGEPQRQQMEFRHHGKGRHGHGGPGGMGRMIDANFDNVIGDDEAASLADREFMRLDQDRNGSVTEAEFTAPRGPQGRWWRQWTQSQDQAVADGLSAKFTTLDADKNGQVTKAEFLTDAKTRYAAADADKDGKVSPWEFRAAN
jgi:EF hand